MKKTHTMSPRAKRVLNPAGVIAAIMFVSFIAHLLWLGTSSFPGGYIDHGRYLVAGHGKLFELTATQYWFSYIHGVLLVVSFATVFAFVGYFYWNGELQDNYH